MAIIVPGKLGLFPTFGILLSSSTARTASREDQFQPRTLLTGVFPLTAVFYSEAEKGKLKQWKQKTNHLFSDISVKDQYFGTSNTHLYNHSRNTCLLGKVLFKL